MFDMYTEVILDYYRYPRNHGSISDANAHSRDLNPLCGDEIEIFAKIEDGKIADIKFSGRGCAISQAATSMLTEQLKGKSIEEVKKLGKEDVLAMLGIEISAVRIKCALLGLKVAKTAVYSYLGEKMGEEV